MIELNSKTQQDFLNREWAQELLDAGVDMSDAKYRIHYCTLDDYTNVKKDYVVLAKDYYPYESENPVPTYTVSELLYKLHEYIFVTIDGVEYKGSLEFYKDAPFYTAYYALHNDRDELNHNYLCAMYEHPIESLVSLLLQCMQKGIGCNSGIDVKE